METLSLFWGFGGKPRRHDKPARPTARPQTQPGPTTTLPDGKFPLHPTSPVTRWLSNGKTGCSIKQNIASN